MKHKHTGAFETDSKDLFVVFDGVRIAKRGRPGTPQARTWISLEPGYAVYDDPAAGEHGSIVVECKDERVQ
jgi:hypothetical protein